MWVRCQHKEELKPPYREIVNLDKCFEVKLDILGNVGRIWACKENGDEYLLGEYRDYAAVKVFGEIELLMDQESIYLMPDEQAANERYKETKIK